MRSGPIPRSSRPIWARRGRSDRMLKVGKLKRLLRQDPRHQGRLLRGATTGRSSPSSVPTARAKSTTLKTLSGILRSRSGSDHLPATRTSPTSSPTSIVAQGPGPCAGGPPDLPADDRAGESGDGRVIPAGKFSPAGPGGRVQPLPPAEGAPQPDRRAPSPAASSRCWPWAVR